jgi:hypothetical protein
MDSLPAAIKDAFYADIVTVATARAESVVESTRSAQASCWTHWENFCRELRIDSHLIGVQGAEVYLQVFLVRVRRGDLNRAHATTRAGTVAKYLCAISKEIIRMVDSPSRTSAIAPKSYHASIKEMLKAFTRKDPPPNRVWPVNATIVTELYRMAAPQGFTPNQWRRIQDMCVIGFFFMLRPGEYASTTTKEPQTVPFRLEHAYFLREHELHIVNPTIASCNDSTIHFCGLRLDDQKNRSKGESITHEATNKPICPVRSLKRIAHEIITNNGTSKTPLYQYYETAGPGAGTFCTLTSKHLTAALRLAAAKCQHITGIPPDKITARSLRAGGATALLCAKIDKEIVKLLGHWRGDSVDVYLRTSTHTVTRGFSTKMLEHGNYKFISYENENDFTAIPDLLPDDTDDEVLDAYYKLITEPTPFDPSDDS